MDGTVVGVPVAAAAEDRTVSLAEDGGGGGVAEVAEKGAGVLGEEGVGGVDVAVAAEAELRGVGAAVEEGRGGGAVVAEPHLLLVIIFHVSHLCGRMSESLNQPIFTSPYL